MNRIFGVFLLIGFGLPFKSTILISLIWLSSWCAQEAKDAKIENVLNIKAAFDILRDGFLSTFFSLKLIKISAKFS